MATNYRADHVGSLVRPQELLDARDRYRAGEIQREELRKLEDEAILGALAIQQKAGLDIYTDGEFRRDAWQTNISEAVDGFQADYPFRENVLADGTKALLEMHTKPVVGRLQPKRRLAGVDAAFLKEHAPGPWKITMPSPSCVARQCWVPGLTDKAYPTREELQREVVEIVRAEVAALAGDGCSYIQLDEGFNSYVNPEWRANLEKDGRDPEDVLTRDIAADNKCYEAARTNGMVTAMHLCRGSRSNRRGTGDYEWLAEHLFGQLNVDRFLLEYDSDVVGGFEPLRHLPRGKIVVLGLVTTKDARVETRDELMRKIEEAARYCPIEQLAISPQCGFQAAANPDGTRMTIQEQNRKLEVMAQVAQEVWGQE
jgi:5-methyltetrahydropteroyltriglutamate--homocysteine methyltransferase